MLINGDDYTLNADGTTVDAIPCKDNNTDLTDFTCQPLVAYGTRGFNILLTAAATPAGMDWKTAQDEAAAYGEEDEYYYDDEVTGEDDSAANDYYGDYYYSNYY